jgi:hypothetical protein
MGCAKATPPTVENNVFISTSTPKIKIRVKSDIPFVRSEKITPNATDSGGSESTIGLVRVKYIFGSENGSKAFTIEKWSFMGPSQNWDFDPIDYSQESNVLESGTFKAGKATYSTGIFMTNYKGQNYFHKYYSRLIGNDIRLVLSYTHLSKVVIKDPEHLSNNEQQHVWEFSRLADSSFDILL